MYVAFDVSLSSVCCRRNFLMRTNKLYFIVLDVYKHVHPGTHEHVHTHTQTHAHTH